MAVAQFRLGQAYGYTPTLGGTQSVNQLNAAANWAAYGFTPDANRTLSTIRVFVSARAGTLTGTDVSCSVWDSSGTGGVPGAQLAAGPFFPTATITAAGWYTFTGMSTALTAGQTYWVVVQNGNATPASNFPSLSWYSGTTNAPLVGLTTRQFWGRATSSNSGGAWSFSSNFQTFRVGYADGSFDGVPVQAIAPTIAAFRAFAANEVGVQFTSPANATLNISGLAMGVAVATGAPTGTPRLGLWSGPAGSPTNLGYANLLTTTITGTQWVYGYFGADVVIPPGTTCYVTLGETGGGSDTSSNAWNLEEFAVDTDANSLILLPINGTMQKAYLSSGTFALSTAAIYPVALLLDSGGEFSSAGYPAVGNVLSGVTYNGGTATGTLALPSAAQVLSGISFGAGGTQFTGTITLPTTAQVLSGVTFGAGGASTGTITLPTVNQVLTAVTFGPSGGSTGTVTLPTTAQVQQSVAFGPNNSLTGTYIGAGGSGGSGNNRLSLAL